MGVFYTWLQVSNAKLQHWVISIRLQVKPFWVVHLGNRTQLACVVSAVSWCVSVSWLSKGGRKKIFQTRSQPVKNCKTPNICTYLQIIAFRTRNQIKTFVSTQIHKCKRSVNRLFKGYLLIIYIKRVTWIFSQMLGLETELLDRTQKMMKRHDSCLYIHNDEILQLWTWHKIMNPLKQTNYS